MAARANADAKWSENQLEGGEDSERTVNCLRGRLLAERMASRNAREQAEQFGNKLMALESLLKEEAKSRNRAEKKLKSLMKKLASLNISYSTDVSSSLMDKTEVSSVCSSIASSNGKDKEKSMDGFMESLKGFHILQQVHSQECLVSLIPGSSAVDHRFKVDLHELRMPPLISEVLNQGVQLNSLEKPNQLNSDGSMDSVAGVESMESSENTLKKEDDQDLDNRVNNSLELVSVDVPHANQAVDPEVLNGRVKEVLDTLHRGKDQIHSSMERRRAMSMIKVGWSNAV